MRVGQSLYSSQRVNKSLMHDTKKREGTERKKKESKEERKKKDQVKRKKR